jgi:hypothetical protein
MSDWEDDDGPIVASRPTQSVAPQKSDDWSDDEGTNGWAGAGRGGYGGGRGGGFRYARNPRPR